MLISRRELSSLKPLMLLVLTAAISSLTVAATFLLPLDDMLGLTTIVIGLVSILYLCRLEPRIALPLLLGFLIRALLALAHVYVFRLPYSQDDAIAFEELGLRWSQDGIGNLWQHFTTGAWLYSWLIAVLYSLTDHSVLMIQAVNVFFGSLIIWNVYQTTKLLWTEREAARAAWIVAFFPTMALFSALTLREVAVVYPLTLAAFYFIRWAKRNNLRDFFVSLLLLIFAAVFHSGILGAIIAVSCFGLYKTVGALKRQNAATFLSSTLALIAVLVLLLAVTKSGVGLEKVGSVEDLTFEALSEQQGITARDRASYLNGITINDPLDFVWQAPLRIIYFLFTPFLWMVGSTSDLIGFFDALLYLVFALMLFLPRRQIKSNICARALLFLAMSLVLTFALPTSNYGTALRHRSKIAPLLVPLAVCLPTRKKTFDTCKGDK